MPSSRKSREMQAEQLLKVSTNLFTAFYVSILVFPITAMVGGAFNGKLNSDFIDVIVELFTSWYVVVFLLAELGIYAIVVWARDKAFEIYDELYPDLET